MRGVRIKNLIETSLRSEGSLDKGSKVENAQMHPSGMLGLRAQNILEYDENPSRGLGQAVQPGKAAEQYCYYQEMLTRGSGKGVPPGKTAEQYCYYQGMPFRGFGQGGLPRKGSRTKSFSSEALARGSPRKGSSTSLLFPGNAF